MTDINALLNIGGNALLLQQKAISLTGNNIANVNTPGYSRQRLILGNNTPLQSAAGPMGYGVRAIGIERIYDQFVGIQLNNENANLGRWEAQKSSLERVEFIFNESAGYGLSQAMSEMFNAWRDLSLNPSGQTERVVLLSQAQFLTDTFRKTYGDLQSAQAEIDTAVENAVDDINRLAAEIADLNVTIVERETSGHTANDLRDRRDQAAKEMANLIDVETHEDSDGRVLVTVGSGRVLVDAGSSHNLSVQVNGSGHVDLYWPDDATAVNINSEIGGGKIKGWLEARDTKIDGYMQRLDTLAQTMMQEFNTLHGGGYGLDSSTGRDFFEGSGAQDIAVHADIVADVTRIAAADTLAGVPGDNGNAIEIANLQHKLTMSGGSATFDDFANALVSDVGHDVKQAGIYQSQEAGMMAHLENYRESISGVSLDEEMVNLVKFQAAFDAAAKLITTADELFETVLGLVR